MPFVENHTPIYDHELWIYGPKDKCDIILRVEDLIEYVNVYEFISGRVLVWYFDKRVRVNGLKSKG